MTNGNVWRTISIALFSALLSGFAAVTATSAKRAQLEERVAVQETKIGSVEQRLIRIEDKLDQLLAQHQ